MQRIGTVVINRRTKKIARLLNADSISNEVADNSTASRWYSVDPLAEKYRSISPYAFVANNPIIYKDPNGAYIEGIDGKPVFFEMKNGKAIWSANASADTRRIGNAMLKTTTGREMVARMQNTDYAIGVHLNNKSDGDFGKTHVKGSFDENGKFVVERGDIYVNVNAMMFWKRGFDAQTKNMKNINTVLKERINSTPDGEEKQAYQYYLLFRTDRTDDAIGATGSHEADHVTSPENIQADQENVRDERKAGYNKQDIETVPNQIEQKDLNERL